MSTTVVQPPSIVSDRYRISRELGAGGMATVYLAHDMKHGRDVALKVLHPDLAASLGRERFLREIQLTARLSHPHILPLFDSGDAAGVLYYVMPVVRGESLRDRLTREGRLGFHDAVRIAPKRRKRSLTRTSRRSCIATSNRRTSSCRMDTCNTEEGIAYTQRTMETFGRHPWMLQVMTGLFMQRGDRRKAEAIHAELEARAVTSPVQFFSRAVSAIYLGRIDAAFDLALASARARCRQNRPRSCRARASWRRGRT